MNQISFKSRVRVMAIISFIESIFLISSILGLITNKMDMCIFSFITYVCFKVIANIIWRCPKCKAKLPKGKYTHIINKCSYCNYDLVIQAYMKKIRKRILFVLGILICLVIVYKCFISGHSMLIFGDDSISEYRTIELGNIKQSVLIRGTDKSNPVLLYIHGGPGGPETSFIVHYQKEWEEYFTVVNWDQRGSGRSYDAKIDEETLTTDQICLDAIELTKYLKKEFQVDKIYLVCHSYGTYVGMKCIQMNPEDYYAYVGMGQIGNQQKNEKNLITYASEMAQKDSNQEALDELATLGELPYDKTNFGDKISLSRKWTTYYGGAIYGKDNTNCFITEAIIRPEYSLVDLIHFLKGEDLYYSNTEKDQARWELFNANLLEEVPSVEVPIYFVQGKNDFITSYEACETYFKNVQAPYKELIPISECAHNPIVEKKDDVSDILIIRVLKFNSTNTVLQSDT